MEKAFGIGLDMKRVEGAFLQWAIPSRMKVYIMGVRDIIDILGLASRLTAD